MATPTLEALIDLARAAGREIMNVRGAGFDTQTKRDGSLVTIADQHAELIIERGLAHLAPEIPMIGEEAVAGGRIPECGARFFCVDPLDGTRGFTQGSDEFTVNIALIEGGAPVMGVVYAPALGELFAGERGRAVRMRDSESALAPIAARETASAQWRIIVSELSGRNERTNAFIGSLNGSATQASSSIKFCRIAEGAADLYPRFGEVSEWDAAAGQAVLEAAGGGVMRLDGSPVRYGDRSGSFRVDGFIAYANEIAKQAALDALKS